MDKETKLCAECGQPFEPKNSQQLFCDRPHYKPCPVCGKLVFRPKEMLNKPPVTCSYACRKVVHESHLPIL